MVILRGRMAALIVAGAAVSLSGLSAPVANAQPAGFPDVDTFRAVDPADYQVFGAHPSLSGWIFRTPGGLVCRDSLIPDLGVACDGSVVGAPPGMNVVTVSLTSAGRIAAIEPSPDDQLPALLPTGTKIDAGNGVVCAVPADDALACRAQKPDSWPKDTPDPPDRHYGEHGFVVQPSGSWTY